MGNIKIHEIAKELGVNSKEVLEKARNIGIEVKSHLSSVDEETANKIRNNFKAKKETVETKPVKENKKEVAEKKPKDAKKDKKSQEEHVIISRVLRGKEKYKGKRIKVIFKGIISGWFFKPSVEYVEKEQKSSEVYIG